MSQYQFLTAMEAPMKQAETTTRAHSSSDVDQVPVLPSKGASEAELFIFVPKPKRVAFEEANMAGAEGDPHIPVPPEPPKWHKALLRA